jgi:hypothetical protein
MHLNMLCIAPEHIVCCNMPQVHAAASPSQRTLVLLDAAAYLPTHDLDLSTHPADFVAASFYKMFGYPTGLGVLVLRTEHVPLLNKVCMPCFALACLTDRDEVAQEPWQGSFGTALNSTCQLELGFKIVCMQPSSLLHWRAAGSRALLDMSWQ